jgi:hypothetical protein
VRSIKWFDEQADCREKRRAAIAKIESCRSGHSGVCLVVNKRDSSEPKPSCDWQLKTVRGWGRLMGKKMCREPRTPAAGRAMRETPTTDASRPAMVLSRGVPLTELCWEIRRYANKSPPERRLPDDPSRITASRSASLAKKLGKVLRTHAGLRRRIPGTRKPSMPKHIAMR